MLSEEALIVLAAFGACGLLILGVLELLWPTRPRHPVRRRAVVPRSARPHRQSALVRHAKDRRAPYGRPQTLPAPVALAPASPAVVLPTPPAVETAAVPTAADAPSAQPTTPEALALEIPALELPPASTAPAVPGEEESIVEVCFALYQEQRFSDVIDRAADALTAGPDGRPLSDPQAAAALWSVVALARQALGEDTGARTELENAIALAPDADRATYQRQLAALAESVAEGLLAEARRHATPDSDDCLGMIRSAVAWLDRAVAATPDNTALAEQATVAQALLWPAWERTVVALAQHQEFRAARRLLREALADPRFPAARAETFKELFSGTFSGEIGQLTAQAIRSMQEARESDALASLKRAETLLDTLNAEALPPSRRQEVDRRLWWGYNKLGARRVEAGDPEAALEPLFHALAYDVGPARRQETVALLVRALDGVADARALHVRELAEAGDREAALVQCDKLWAQLRSATEMGLAQTELAATFGKVQGLFERLGSRPA